MDTATRTSRRPGARTGVATVLGLAAAATVVLGLSVVYGFASEYGAGSFADLSVWVAAPPVLLATLAVFALPRATPRWRTVVVAGTAAVMIGGGVAADAAGAHAKADRLAEGSRDFRCNGVNAEGLVPDAVDRTWRDLPRRAPIYGPIESSRTSCVAAVAGDGDQTFPAYTEAFRELDGWQVTVDQPQRFVMVRDHVRVTVLLDGEPDHLTTIGVAARG